MKRNRSGLKLVELLVCVAVIGILVALSFTVIGCNRNDYSIKNTGVFRCVKAYPHTTGTEDSTSTSKRVDLKPAKGGATVTMECNDSRRADIWNSAQLYAQFEKGKWYKVTYLGTRKTGRYSYFPLVSAVEEVPDPNAE